MYFVKISIAAGLVQLKCLSEICTICTDKILHICVSVIFNIQNFFLHNCIKMRKGSTHWPVSTNSNPIYVFIHQHYILNIADIFCVSHQPNEEEQLHDNYSTEIFQLYQKSFFQIYCIKMRQSGQLLL